MTDITARAYRSEKVARDLAGEPLAPAEVVILIRHRDAYLGKRVLDLGVGSGRTTRYIVPFAADYLGIDLSPQMLARARRDHPGIRFGEGDLRNLEALALPPADFILIAYNTLDVLGHDDRERCLSLLSRLIVPGGMLVFSSHNRDWRRCGKPPAIARPHGPGDLPRYLYRTVRSLRERVNHHRLAHLQRVEEDHAVVTGSVERSGLVYCISRAHQEAQLSRTGFELAETYDSEGRLLPKGEIAADSYNLHFVCRNVRHSGPSA